MPCYHPLEGYKSRVVSPDTGKRDVVFNPRDGFSDLPVQLACGQCVGCRIARSQEWAVRCVHQASLSRDNAFLTLTYRDEDLPYGGTLVKKHHQDFMKRLRRSLSHRIGYFHCGEYGEEKRRPHYHDLLFNHDFRDKVAYKRNGRGEWLFTSPTLDDLWGLGDCLIGAVTFESAAYCARYVMKKITGDLAKKHYEVIVPETGEILQLLPEYITMSLNPAIGKEWYERFSEDVYPSDFVVVAGGRTYAPPSYYDTLHELSAPDDFRKLGLERAKKAGARSADRTPERLAVREKVRKAQLNQSYKRTL